MDIEGLARLRRRVLEAWTASPARFREDANAEEELALGAYRDRLIIELAQNASDAAIRGGAPGRFLLRLDGDALLAANTGQPLDDTGVEGLSTLRASPKRDEPTVGRFGVGFAAVLSVTDEPAVVSRTGALRWSRAEAARLAADVPGLAPEVRRRGGAVPVLRLPFPVEAVSSTGMHGAPSGGTASGTASGAARREASGEPTPDGDPVTRAMGLLQTYDTVVVLPFRGVADAAAVRAQLADVDAVLALVLPGIGEITVESADGRRTITAVAPTTGDQPDGDSTDGARDPITERVIDGRRWRLARSRNPIDLAAGPRSASPHSAGEHAASDPAAGRPVEERSRPSSAAVAVEVDHRGRPLPSTAPRVFHAPTPTDDPTALPVLVIADFPVDSGRRRIVPGPLTDQVAEAIGAAYTRLVASFPGPETLALIPAVFGENALDTTVHTAIRETLRQTAFVPGWGDGRLLRPDQVTVVEGLELTADPAAVGALVDGGPEPDWQRIAPLRSLGATVMSLADLVEQLRTLRLDPRGWWNLYDALDGAPADALGTLPVPLADGRLITGARSVLLPGEVDPGLAEAFSLRVAHPDAAHPLLARLGATELTPGALLRDGAVRGAVEAADDDDAAPIADAVLRLVALANVSTDDEPWLAQLPIPDETGEPAPAGELFLPGSELVELLDADPDEFTVASSTVDTHGEEVLTAVGVRSGFAVIRHTDVPLDADLDLDTDDGLAWVERTLDELPEDDLPPLISEVAVVRDLELIRDDAWPRALELLAAEPATRGAVMEPAFALLTDGTRRGVDPYTRWWLRRYARIDGRQPGEVCAEDAAPAVRAVLHTAALRSDAEFNRAIGVASALSDIATAVLLDRLADERLQLPAALLTDIYAELDGRPVAGVPAPSRIRVPAGAGTEVIDRDDAVVCDGPHWLQLGLPGAIPGSAELAELLDTDVAADAFDVTVEGGGAAQQVPPIARTVLTGAADSYVEYDDLRVGGHPVQWWLTDATVHAATLDGLARGLAWTAGAWERRWVLAEVLQDPDRVDAILAEDGFRRL